MQQVINPDVALQLRLYNYFAKVFFNKDNYAKKYPDLFSEENTVGNSLIKLYVDDILKKNKIDIKKCNFFDPSFHGSIDKVVSLIQTLSNTCIDGITPNFEFWKEYNGKFADFITNKYYQELSYPKIDKYELRQYTKYIKSQRKQYIQDNEKLTKHQLNNVQDKLMSIKSIDFDSFDRFDYVEKTEQIYEPHSIDISVPAWLFFYEINRNRLISTKVKKEINQRTNETKFKKIPDINLLREVYGDYSWTNCSYRDKFTSLNRKQFREQVKKDNFKFALLSDYVAIVNGNSILKKSDKALITIDIDTKGLKPSHLAYIWHNYFNCKPMIYQKSISGGYHIFAYVDGKTKFAKNNSVKSVKIKVSDNDTTIPVDIRTNNGYTVVDGKGYQNIHCLMKYQDLKDNIFNTISDKIQLMTSQDIDSSMPSVSVHSKADIALNYPINAFYQFLCSGELSKIVSISDLVIHDFISLDTRMNKRIDVHDKVSHHVHKDIRDAQWNHQSFHMKNEIKDIGGKLNESDVFTRQVGNIQNTKFSEDYVEGCRNNTVFSLACWLHLNGWSRNEANSYIQYLNEESSDPLSSDEVAKTIRSAFNEGHQYGLSKDGLDLIEMNLVRKDNTHFNFSVADISDFDDNCYQQRKRKAVPREGRKNSHYDEFIRDLLGVTVDSLPKDSLKINHVGSLPMTCSNYGQLAITLSEYAENILGPNRLTTYSYSEVKMAINKVIKPIMNLSTSDIVYLLHDLIYDEDIISRRSPHALDALGDNGIDYPFIDYSQDKRILSKFKMAFIKANNQYHENFIKTHETYHLKPRSKELDKFEKSKVFVFISIRDILALQRLSIKTIKGHGININVRLDLDNFPNQSNNYGVGLLNDDSDQVIHVKKLNCYNESKHLDLVIAPHIMQTYLKIIHWRFFKNKVFTGLLSRELIRNLFQQLNIKK